MKLANQLHEALISAGVQIDGVSIGRENDKSTWRIHMQPDAPDYQRLIAADIVKVFSIEKAQSAYRAFAAMEPADPNKSVYMICKVMLDKGLLCLEDFPEELRPGIDAYMKGETD